MILKKEETEQFYDLWIPLLDFVNQKYRLIKELYGMTSPQGLPLEGVALLSEKLMENKMEIDAFIFSGVKRMDAEEVALVSSWKRALHGQFIVDRHLRTGSVLVSLERNEAYLVKGLYSSWREMLGNHPLPQAVHTTLLPFRDKIIHNGILRCDGGYLNRATSEQSKQICLTARATGNLRDRL